MVEMRSETFSFKVLIIFIVQWSVWRHCPIYALTYNYYSESFLSRECFFVLGKIMMTILKEKEKKMTTMSKR